MSLGDLGNELGYFRSIGRNFRQIQDRCLGLVPHLLRNIKMDFLNLVRNLRGNIRLVGFYRNHRFQRDFRRHRRLRGNFLVRLHFKRRSRGLFRLNFNHLFPFVGDINLGSFRRGRV